MTNKVVRLIFIALPLALAMAPAPAMAAGFETPPVLAAAKVLPAGMVKGPAYRVRSEVLNDGLLNTYVVDSAYGRFQALSNLALAKLEGELVAIDAMAKLDTGDVFVKGVKQGAQNTVRGVKNLFTDPKGAVEGAASGLGRLFDRAGESLKGSDAAAGEDSRSAQFIGFSKAKRQLAARFGVDAYSANPVLQEHLDRLAWADYSGGISVGAATMVVPGVAGLAVSASGGTRLLNEVMATTPPAELHMQNRQKLTSMGVGPDLIDLFLGSALYSPRDQTVIVSSLESMGKVANRALAVKSVLMAPNRDVAQVLANMAAMYAAYNKRVGPLAELRPMGRIFYARAANGKAVIALPTDYIVWTPKVVGALQQIAADGAKGGDLWITGSVSRRTAKEFGQAGWRVTDHVERQLEEKTKQK